MNNNKKIMFWTYFFSLSLCFSDSQVFDASITTFEVIFEKDNMGHESVHKTVIFLHRDRKKNTTPFFDKVIKKPERFHGAVGGDLSNSVVLKFADDYILLSPAINFKDNKPLKTEKGYQVSFLKLKNLPGDFFSLEFDDYTDYIFIGEKDWKILFEASANGTAKGVQ